MTNDEKLMQQALEALENPNDIDEYNRSKDDLAITALRERLAQPEQEPVGYFKLSGFNVWWQVSRADSDIQGVVPLYTSPPAQQEPVAWTTMPDAYDWTFISGSSDPNGKLDGKWHPLYTTPQPAQQGGGNLPPPLEQQPVAWRDPKNADPGQGCTYDKAAHEKWPHIYTQPLYTAPQPRQWQGLTDEELKRMWVEYRAAIPRYLCFARAIDAKLREKNGGGV